MIRGHIEDGTEMGETDQQVDMTECIDKQRIGGTETHQCLRPLQWLGIDF